MIHPDEGTLERFDSYDGAEDEWGLKDESDTPTEIYSGRCRYVDDVERALYPESSEQADVVIFLPGQVDAQPGDRWTDEGGRKGRVLDITTGQRRYTRLTVQWV